jgi:hypothetical protein
VYNPRRMKRLLLFPLLVGLGAPLVNAAEPIADSRSLYTDVIDIPTGDVVDHYGYDVSFRFASEGAVQAKTLFGVLPRLNIGFGLDGEHVIGTEDMRVNKPTINAKFQIIKPDSEFSTLALGYDGQGYQYNKTTGKYNQREKGLYLASSTRIFRPELLFHLGGDVFDFSEHNSARAFAGLTYTYQQMFQLMFEYDNVDMYKERRINYGLKIFVSPVFTVDLIGRNVPVYQNDKTRETERVVRLSYAGSF